MKRYEVTIEIDSNESEDKVRLFLMRSISQIIATTNYRNYREDTLKLKIKEGDELPSYNYKRKLISIIIIMFIGFFFSYGVQEFFNIDFHYVYETLKGFFKAKL